MWIRSLSVMLVLGCPVVGYAASVSGGGSAQGLDANFDLQPMIDGATPAKPLVAWNGEQGVELYGDPTLGGVIRPKPLGDTPWRCWNGFKCVLRDESTGTAMLEINPLAATPRGKYLFKTGHYPLKSYDLPAGYWSGDGVNCPETATDATINSGPKQPTFICADSSGSILFAVATLPDDYVAGTTIKIRQYIIQTAANTGSVLGDFSAQCRGNTEVVSNTWGTAVASDLASATGSNAVNSYESAAITPAGTCNPGDLLFLRYVFDSASTTASATLHFINFKLIYSSESLSH